MTIKRRFFAFRLSRLTLFSHTLPIPFLLRLERNTVERRSRREGGPFRLRSDCMNGMLNDRLAHERGPSHLGSWAAPSFLTAEAADFAL